MYSFIQVDSDGYFVHILRNDDLPVLNKHAIFVLDVSGSMSGSKLQQLKDAMDKILQDLSDSDRFSIVLFSESVMVSQAFIISLVGLTTVHMDNIKT